MTNPNILRCIVVAVVLRGAPALAQAPAQELTLGDAVRQALQSHPALELSAAHIARARTGVSEARAARLPGLNFDANLTRFQEPMVVAPLHGFDPRNPPIFDRTLSQSSLTAAYTLFDASRGARIDRAEVLAAAATSSATTTEMQVLADVVRAFLRVRSAREIATAHDHRIVALTRERDRVAQLVEQGKAARVAVLRTDAALSGARADGVSASGDVDLAENELARQMDASVQTIRRLAIARVRVKPDTQASNVAVLRAMARDSNPEIARARRQVAAAAGTRAEARGLRLPRVQLGGRFVEYASGAGHPQGEWQGGAQLSYPILTGGARQAASDRANADIRAAQAELNLTERRIDETIDRAFAALSSTRARAEALESAVTQSAEVTRIDRLALEAGAGVQSEYLTAQADLFRVRAALTEARALAVLARVEIARASGLLTENWIARNVESYP